MKILRWIRLWLLGLLFKKFPGGVAIDPSEVEDDLRLRREKGKKKYIGKLGWFYETGIEGLPWILEEDGKPDMADIQLIEAGDHLKIYGEDGTVVFDGEIVPDYEAGKIEHPVIKGMKAQFALGCWVCWIQRGWQPDAWAALFLRDEDKRLRAELTIK